MLRRTVAVVLVAVVVGSVVGVVAVPSGATDAAGTAAVLPESEPNDDPASADALAAGATETGAATGSDTDWFAVPVERGQSVTVTLQTAGTLDVALFDADRRTLDSARASAGSVTVGATAAQNGTAFVQVRPVGGTGGEYSVSASVVAGDAFEPNEVRATAVELPNETVAAALGVGDEDWYRFDATRGEFLTVSFSRLGDGGSMDVVLYDPDGRTIVSERVGSGGSTTAAGTATQTGTYYVQVRSVGGLGAYTLAAASRATDAFEPNEERSSAVDLTRGATVTGELTTGDQDWFALRVEETDVLRVSLTRLSDGGSMDVVLYGPDGRTIDAERVGSRGAVTVTADAAATGAHYVQVRPVGGTGAYELDARTLVRAAEPSDELAQATPLGNERTAIATLDAGDVDWFAFRGGVGQSVTVDVDRFGGAGEAVAVLTGPNGTELDRVRLQSGESGQLGATATTTGVYAVAVRSDDLLAGEGEYTVGVSSAPGDAFEPNEGPASALVVEAGSVVNGTLSVTDRDAFALDATAGDRIDVALSNVTVAQSDGTVGGRFVLTVDGPNGTVATETVRDGETATLSVVAESTGRYLVTVASVRSELDLTASVGGYALAVDAVLPDSNEPNDVRAAATALDPNATAAAVLAPADVDWYETTVAANGTLSVSVDRDVESGVVAVLVYGPDGTSTVQYVTADASASLAVAPGTYAVQVVDVNAGAGPYGVTLAFTPDEPDAGSDETTAGTDASAGPAR